tara:strand:- start:300 stop:1103 length:804 start_codon:yes stop_codon:yes gene_type:complete
MSLGDLIKDIAPVLIGATLGPGIAGAGVNPFISRAVTGAITSKLAGGKSKDAVRNALLAGIGGMAFDNFSGQQTPVEGTNVRSDLPSGSRGSGQFLDNRGTNQAAAKIMENKPPVEVAAEKIAGTPKTFSGELLKSAGIGDDNLLARLLNTRVGEGLTAGLIAQLLAGDDDDEQQREFETRPFGFGGPGGQLGGITYAADGGPMNFPRRTGGIDPSEGSGTKDDVPAMLMAGEFVLTKDAVKGLGDGNQRKGIQRAYDMMSNLEARA